MGIFATLVRRGAHAEVTADAVPDRGRAQRVLPARFEAVGERLAAGHDASSACAEVGRETARDGADLGEALDGLRTTYARVQGGEPDFRALRALCMAWSEETLGYLHQLSCEDPLTGLASLAHLRARLSEVYRGAEQGGRSTNTSHALVVVDVPLLARRPSWRAAADVATPASSQPCGWPGWPSTRGWCSREGRPSARRARRGWSWSPSGGTCSHREWGCCAISSRTWTRGEERARVWIEGLPPSDDGAGLLLDEIARS